MIVKNIIDEDFVNYKKPAMFIVCPRCSFKCDKEAGTQICQNCALANDKDIIIDTNKIIDRYINNPITKSVVFGGLEPFDTFYAVMSFIDKFREKCDDDVVIYTGYTEDECENQIALLKRYDNIILKFGRFIPNEHTHYDDILGVELASSNQYGKRIS